MNETKIAPKWFKSIAIIAVLWNVMGVLAFITHITMTTEAIAALPVEQQALYVDIPLWVTLAFGIAVFTGLLGSIGLLLKKPISLPILQLSLITIIAHDIYSFFFTKIIEILGIEATIMPSIVIIIAILLILLANKANKNQWFN
ncbi:hypothetical protein ACOYR1_05050 [Thalassotalea piscium]